MHHDAVLFVLLVLLTLQVKVQWLTLQWLWALWPEPRSNQLFLASFRGQFPLITETSLWHKDNDSLNNYPVYPLIQPFLVLKATIVCVCFACMHVFVWVTPFIWLFNAGILRTCWHCHASEMPEHHLNYPLGQLYATIVWFIVNKQRCHVGWSS